MMSQRPPQALRTTTYHWELPQFVQERGGWSERFSVDLFQHYVRLVVENLGDLVTGFFVLNEPWCAGWLGYHEGVHAPGEKSLPKALAAIHHLLLAQGRAVRLLRQIAPTHHLSTAYNLSPFYPASDMEQDKLAQQFADCNVNRWYLDPLFLGEYPEPLLSHFSDAMPSCYRQDLLEIKVGGLLDSLGINFYSGGLVAWDEETLLRFKFQEIEQAEKNGLGWTVFVPPYCPAGFFELLTNVYKTYAPHGLISIEITENGTAWGDHEIAATSADDFRIRYLESHLRQVVGAIEAGVPVESYYLWTLIDNFDWAFGYTPKSSFGLVAVDRESMRRTPKRSFYWYQELIAGHSQM